MNPGLIQEGNTVGVTLIGGDEAVAVAAVITESHPQAEVSSYPTYVTIRAPYRIEIDLGRVSEALGKPIDAPTFLVNMASFYGRIDVEDDRVTFSSDITV